MLNKKPIISELSKLIICFFLLYANQLDAQEKTEQEILATELSDKSLDMPLNNPFPFEEKNALALDPSKYTYNIDLEHSSVNFRVKHMGFAWVEGRFRDFYGTFIYNPESIESSKTNVAIRASSIDTASIKRDKHLKSADFLDHTNFKKIFFISNAVEKAGENHFKLKGVLTIKNTQKEIVLDVISSNILMDPWGNQRAAFEATTVINRKDFNLTWNRVLEAGALLVGEEVEIKLSIQGVLQKDNSPKLQDPTRMKKIN